MPLSLGLKCLAQSGTCLTDSWYPPGGHCSLFAPTLLQEESSSALPLSALQPTLVILPSKWTKEQAGVCRPEQTYFSTILGLLDPIFLCLLLCALPVGRLLLFTFSEFFNSEREQFCKDLLKICSLDFAPLPMGSESGYCMQSSIDFGTPPWWQRL